MGRTDDTHVPPSDAREIPAWVRSVAAEPELTRKDRPTRYDPYPFADVALSLGRACDGGDVPTLAVIFEGRDGDHPLVHLFALAVLRNVFGDPERSRHDSRERLVALYRRLSTQLTSSRMLDEAARHLLREWKHPDEGFPWTEGELEKKLVGTAIGHRVELYSKKKVLGFAGNSYSFSRAPERWRDLVALAKARIARPDYGWKLLSKKRRDDLLESLNRRGEGLGEKVLERDLGRGRIRFRTVPQLV